MVNFEIHYPSFKLCSVGVHVMVEDVNEFAPKWNIRSDPIPENEKEPLHTLTTGVAIEEGQLFEEVIYI